MGDLILLKNDYPIISCGRCDNDKFYILQARSVVCTECKTVATILVYFEDEDDLLP